MLLKDLRNVKEVYPYDVLQVLRDKGIVIGKVILDSRKFITECAYHDVSPMSVKKLIAL
jgi:hypothetical protein